MPLSQKAVEDFQRIYKEVKKEEISLERAREYAEGFMELFILAIKKRPKMDYNKEAITR